MDSSSLCNEAFSEANPTNKRHTESLEWLLDVGGRRPHVEESVFGVEIVKKSGQIPNIVLTPMEGLSQSSISPSSSFEDSHHTGDELENPVLDETTGMPEAFFYNIPSASYIGYENRVVKPELAEQYAEFISRQRGAAQEKPGEHLIHTQYFGVPVIKIYVAQSWHCPQEDVICTPSQLQVCFNQTMHEMRGNPDLKRKRPQMSQEYLTCDIEDGTQFEFDEELVEQHDPTCNYIEDGICECQLGASTSSQFSTNNY